MPAELLAAVRELTAVVKRLEEALTEYPKRHEVEERFATKHESRSRAVKFLLIGLVFVLISFVASIIVTVGTVSTCFTSASARTGQATGACSALPGYDDAQDRNQTVLRQFEELLKQPAKNDKRLDRIEKELGLAPLK